MAMEEKRERLPATRNSVTHRFKIGGTKGYFTVSFYSDGRPGEVFLEIAKEGSTISGFGDMWAQAVSFGLQHGVSIATFIEHGRGTSFEPAGRTSNPNIPWATSIYDYFAQWAEQRLLTKASGEPAQKAG